MHLNLLFIFFCINYFCPVKSQRIQSIKSLGYYFQAFLPHTNFFKTFKIKNDPNFVQRHSRRSCSSEVMSIDLENENHNLKTSNALWPNLWAHQTHTVVGSEEQAETGGSVFTVSQKMALNEALVRVNPEMSFAHANELIKIGAVSTRKNGRNTHSPGISSGTSWTHTTSPCVVEEGTEIKVFYKPRLYPACYCEDWNKRLLYESAEMIIINKPAMLPCQPHQSNYMESAPRCAQRAFYSGKKEEQPLYLCHRLDTVTEGCLVLGKTKAMVNRFKLWSESGKISKEYIALTQDPVAEGILEHYMYFGQEVPGPKLLRKSRPSRQEKSDWKVCKLKVLSCKPTEVSNITLKKVLQGSFVEVEYGPVSKLYEVKIQLLTGRTHQIRAQLASSGAPIIGDTLYWKMKNFLYDENSNSEQLSKSKSFESSSCFETSFPKTPIGLQASRIHFPGTTGVDINVYVGDPWWKLKMLP